MKAMKYYWVGHDAYNGEFRRIQISREEFILLYKRFVRPGPGRPPAAPGEWEYEVFGGHKARLVAEKEV